MTTTMQLVNKEVLLNLALGIIFDTEKKKILITKRSKSADVSGLMWCFPGGKIEYGEDLEKRLKEKIMEKIGLRVESLGAIFASTISHENKKMLSVYYLCEFVDGETKLCKEIDEVKWVSPEEIESHFGEKLHPSLKEYLMSLK